jgi:hypothetical protein
MASEQAGQGVRILASPKYLEPLFVFVIMAIASSRPIFSTASRLLNNLARFLGGTPMMRWAVVLIVAPLLGSLITEPAAMTIAALMISAQFHELKPSMRLRYATLGLLFVNISIGGTLTHFAAPPVVMVAGTWGWDTLFMLQHFGWKSVLSILIANTAVFLVFRKELASLRAPDLEPASEQNGTPASLIAAHLVFMGFVVYVAHYAAMVILAFMFFLAFVAATGRNQDAINLRGPVLVGFFLHERAEILYALDGYLKCNTAVKYRAN